MNLQLHDVSYSYRNTIAVDKVSIEFSTGATMLLGPNGAGKSTLLELIAGVRQPDSGIICKNRELQIPGKRTAAREWRKKVAWLPQTFSAIPGLRVRETVAYLGWLKGMSKRDAWLASEHSLEAVGLIEKAQALGNQLSGGQLRRMAIAGALVHEAELILLDEPTAGLDPAQRKRFREIVASISKEREIIISSHDTDDAYLAFDHVAVMDNGMIRFHGTMQEFVERTDEGVDMRTRIEESYLALVCGEA